MPEARVGYRRLYDAMGASIRDQAEFRESFNTPEGQEVELYIGPKPRFGIVFHGGSHFLIPGREEEGPVFKLNPEDTGNGSPRWFTEITCLEPIQVDEDQYAAFLADDSGARNEVLARAERLRETLIPTIDLVAGTLGLRFHFQFVLGHLSEDPVAVAGEKTAATYAGAWAQLLEDVGLTPVGVEQLRAVLARLGTVRAEFRATAGGILSWLVRAWREREVLSRFFALFIPLEMLLAGERDVNAIAAEQALSRSIRELIKQHAGAERQSLLAHFDRLAGGRRPPLAARFRILAERLALPGWEDDVSAFVMFNRIRNEVMHSGAQSVRLSVEVSSDVVRSLEDFVERYISAALFGDTRVYPSRFRQSQDRQVGSDGGREDAQHDGANQ